MASFHGFFLTFLGVAFLRELYAATLADPSGIGFVAEDERGICGFITGTTQPAGFYRRLIRNRWWRFVVASMKSVMTRPAIILRLFRALSMPEQVTQKSRRGTLMSIAVLPEAQGKGIGKNLVRTFLVEAARRGVLWIDLTTDKNKNDATNDFYCQLGFVWERSFITREGRRMNEYVIDVAQAVDAGNALA